jgi:hypothetical protein
MWHLVSKLFKPGHHYLMVAFVFILPGCQNTEPYQSWEQQWHGHITRLKVTGPALPFYYADSAFILEAEINQLQSEKISTIGHQIDTLERQLKMANVELETITNPAMKTIYAKQVKNMEGRVAYLYQLLQCYQNPEIITQLSRMEQKKQHYLTMPHKLIGYRQQLTLTLKQGALPAETISKTYLLSPDKKRVLGTLQN